MSSYNREPDGIMLNKIPLTTLAPIAINIAALIWGAAKISNSVENLTKSMTELRMTVQTIDSRVNGNTVDIEVIKALLKQPTIKAR